MTILKPRQARGRGALIFVGLVGVAYLVVVTRFLMQGRVSLADVLEIAGGGLIVVAVGAGLILEDERVRSVALSPDGIKAQVWRRLLGILPYKSEHINVAWADVEKVALKGFVVGLRSASEEILINTYLFENPAKVLAFINEHAGKARTP